MNDGDLSWASGHLAEPGEEFSLVGMARKAVYLRDLHANRAIAAKESHLSRAVQDQTPEGAGRLVANEEQCI